MIVLLQSVLGELAMLCGSVFQLVLSIMYALKKKKSASCCYRWSIAQNKKIIGFVDLQNSIQYVSERLQNVLNLSD